MTTTKLSTLDIYSTNKLTANLRTSSTTSYIVIVIEIIVVAIIAAVVGNIYVVGRCGRCENCQRRVVCCVKEQCERDKVRVNDQCDGNANGRGFGQPLIPAPLVVSIQTDRQPTNTSWTLGNNLADSFSTDDRSPLNAISPEECPYGKTYM
jgi:hypothetical protein